MTMSEWRSVGLDGCQYWVNRVASQEGRRTVLARYRAYEDAGDGTMAHFLGAIYRDDCGRMLLLGEVAARVTPACCIGGGEEAFRASVINVAKSAIYAAFPEAAGVMAEVGRGGVVRLRTPVVDAG